MEQYRPNHRQCGRCGAVAVVRLALVAPTENAAAVLRRRAHYRCLDCYIAVVKPSALARNDRLVVIDPAYTRDFEAAFVTGDELAEVSR